jgi:hypothetical protein
MSVIVGWAADSGLLRALYRLRESWNRLAQFTHDIQDTCGWFFGRNDD